MQASTPSLLVQNSSVHILPAQAVPYGADLSAAAIKQRNFIPYDETAVSKFHVAASRQIASRKAWMKDRIKDYCQSGTRTRVKYTVGHTEVEEYYTLFPAENCGKVSAQRPKRKVDGVWKPSKKITHTFTSGKDDSEFFVTKEITVTTARPDIGYEFVDEKSYHLREFSYIYYPDIKHAEVKFYQVESSKSSKRKLQ